VADEIVDDFSQVEHSRPAVNKRNIVYREGGLQRGELVEVVEDHICHCVLLEVVNDTHTVAVRLIINI